MENTNDSPRRPVWAAKRSCNVFFDGKLVGRINESTPIIQVGPAEPRRCICGAHPTPAGDLPCGH